MITLMMLVLIVAFIFSVISVWQAPKAPTSWACVLTTFYLLVQAGVLLMKK